MAAASGESIIDTTAGRVRGSLEASGLVFRGIPFAAPPLGKLRFSAPQPVEPWRGVRDAVEPAPAAPQRRDVLLETLGLLWPDTPQSEDCLALNVFTPGCESARRPVMVWIHGGAFESGTGGVPLYDGARLSERGDVVVVTMNYRVGALGFLSLEDRPHGSPPPRPRIAGYSIRSRHSAGYKRTSRVSGAIGAT